MKILFTGSTAKQCDDNAYKRARVQRIDDSSIICNSLRKQGYLVDRRKVQWGDDLSEYDLAIVGVGQFGSSNYAGDIFNALYAIHTVPNILVFHEDWKIDGTVKSWTKTLEDGVIDEMIAKKWSSGEHFYGGVNNIHFKKDIALQVIRDVVDGKYNALIPAFDWGNKQLVRDIIKSKNIYNLDLTPYVLEMWNIPLQGTNGIKQRKHMLASLGDHRSWVKRKGLTWDVDYFGAKSIPNARQLKTETDVFEQCGNYWSILCPEYPHAGSGWFRIRWVYAAIQGSVLISSEKDLEALGIPVANPESLVNIKLKEYASIFRDAIFKHMWTAEQFDQRLEDIVKANSNKLTKQKGEKVLKLTSLF